MHTKIKTFQGKAGVVDEEVNKFIKGKDIVSIKHLVVEVSGSITLTILVVYKDDYKPVSMSKNK